MSTASTPEPRTGRLPGWLIPALLVLGCVLFLPNLGARDLWDPDEPRYALVSREMWRAGQYFVPLQNGQIYAEKPPLLFWLQGLLTCVAGDHGMWAARLPAALAAIGSVILTGLMGARLFEPLTGLLAGLLLATSHLVQWNGHTGTMDSLVSFWVAFSAWLFVRLLEVPSPTFRQLAPAYVAMGLATLTKGPPGALMLLVAVLAVRWRLMGRTAAMALRPVAGLAVATGICLLWLVPAYLQDGGAYVQAIVFRQTVVRFLQPWHHYQGPLYYFWTLPLDYLPWSGLALAGLIAAWKAGWKERRPEWLFPLAWVAVTVLFFSLSRGKRNVYLLPCFPALALLSAAAVRHWLSGPRTLWLARASTFASAVLGVAGIGALVGAAQKFQPLLPFAAGLCGMTVAGAALGLTLHAGGRSRAAFTAALALASVTFIYMYAVMAPACDFFRSARPFAEAVAAVARPGEPIAAYLLFKPSVAYYLDRRLEEAKDNAEMLALTRGAGGTIACILPVNQIETLKSAGLDYVERVPGAAGAEGLSFGRVRAGAAASGLTTAVAGRQVPPPGRSGPARDTNP